MPQHIKDLTFNEYLRILIYGPSGCGKTWFCGTAGLEGLKAYIFDFDGGITTLKHLYKLRQPNVEYDEFVDTNLLAPTAYATFEANMDSLLASPKFMDADVICVDSITTMQEAMIRDVQRINRSLGKPPTLPEYGIMTDKFRDVMARILGIKKHIIFTGHEQLIQDDANDGEVLLVPLMTGKKLPPRLPLWFDEVYHCEPDIVQNKSVYKFRTKASRRCLAKSRINALNTVEENLTFPDLFKKMKAMDEKEVKKDVVQK